MHHVCDTLPALTIFVKIIASFWVVLRFVDKMNVEFPTHLKGTHQRFVIDPPYIKGGILISERKE